MRRLVVLAWILLAPELAMGELSPARAANGTVALTWDSCTGPIQRNWAGPGGYSIYISVLGIDQPQKAYDVRVIYGDPANQIPDAWAFESGGCQALLDPASASLDYLPPAVDEASCPAFMGTSSPALQITKIILSPLSDPYPTSLVQCLLANSYHLGVAEMNPQTRYFLALFRFDHAHSVEGEGTPGSTCGGVESAMCFRLSNATYLTMDGTEVPFDRDGSSNQLVTLNTDYACSITNPSRPTTWGQLKAQYRN